MYECYVMKHIPCNMTSTDEDDFEGNVDAEAVDVTLMPFRGAGLRRTKADESERQSSTVMINKRRECIANIMKISIV